MQRTVAIEIHGICWIRAKTISDKAVIVIPPGKSRHVTATVDGLLLDRLICQYQTVQLVTIPSTGIRVKHKTVAYECLKVDIKQNRHL